MKLQKRQPKSPPDQRGPTWAAVVLGGFVVLSLGALFLCRSDAGWKTAWERIDWQQLGWDVAERPRRYSEAPKLKFDSIQSPKPPQRDEGDWKFSASRSDQGTLTVFLDQSGRITAGGEERTAADLLEFLCQRESTAEGDIHAILSIDSRCPLRTVTLVTKICEDAGAEVAEIRELEITVVEGSGGYNVGLESAEPRA